jgi:uncharacterized protein (TIGR03435 family)
MTRRLLALLILPLVHAAATHAQDSGQPRFEVASVKRNLANDGRISISGRGGRFTATGVSLKLLLRNAYQMQEFQIVGGPDWLDVDRFDIAATASADVGPPSAVGGPTRQQLMVRSLLADRFHVAVHTETRELPVYALVRARRDGKLGPALTEAPADCTAAAPRPQSPPPAAGPPQLGPCSTAVGPGFIRTRGQTLAQFAAALSTLGNIGASLNRMIIDRTDLPGRYDIELRFTPDRIPNFGPDGPPAGMPPIDPNGPSIFTALQEQLGLKLDAQRGPVDVLVVDRAEAPTAD